MTPSNALPTPLPTPFQRFHGGRVPTPLYPLALEATPGRLEPGCFQPAAVEPPPGCCARQGSGRHHADAVIHGAHALDIPAD